MSDERKLVFESEQLPPCPDCGRKNWEILPPELSGNNTALYSCLECGDTFTHPEMTKLIAELEQDDEEEVDETLFGLLRMELHDITADTEKGLEIVRVPGGWLYKMRSGSNFTFVPLPDAVELIA